MENEYVPELGIIIVNYNTCALLRECLRSVFASEGQLDLAVCVVDNASRDGSVDMVCREFPRVYVISNVDNLGYPQGNNQGLRYFGYQGDRSRMQPLHLDSIRKPVPEPGAEGALPASSLMVQPTVAPVGATAGVRDVPPGAPGWTEGRFSDRHAARLPRYVLLLNPDTVLPPRALADMVAFIAARPRAGVAGPKLVRLDGSLDRACRRSFPTPVTSLYHLVKLDRLFPNSPRFGRYDLTYLDPDVLTQVDAVVGAFMLVRGEAVLDAGLLDETFFMYGEDLDWAKRIKDCGWEVWYNPDVTVLHVKEAASRQSYRARVEFYRALIIFYEKHYRATTPFWLDWSIRGGVAFFGGLDLARRRAAAMLRGG